MQISLIPIQDNHKDVVFTPDDVAREIIEYFKPSGIILEPAKGDGAFLKYLPGAYWCEVREGKDFFAWNEKVDWIVSNPPFSNFTDWMRHSMKLANDIVYLIPINKPFNSYLLLSEIYKWGGIVTIYNMGAGRRVLPNDDLGYAIGAIHFQKGYVGNISIIHKTRLTQRAPDAGDSAASQALSPQSGVSTPEQLPPATQRR